VEDAESSTAKGSRAPSVAERAAHVIANGSISLDAKLGIFTVRGSVEPRLVQLFPKLSCSCPAAGGCYHIAAAKQVIGMRDDVQRRKLNLTLLRICLLSTLRPRYYCITVGLGE